MTANRNIEVEVSAKVDMSDDRAERIRQRAHELYEARGREAGYDTDDWLQAEAEIVTSEASHEEHSA
jgi:hypothetical protein